MQEPVIQSIIELLCRRLEEKSHAGEVVDVWPCYVALTSDFIYGYSFGTSLDQMNSPEFGSESLHHIIAASMSCHILKQFPWLLSITELAPDWVNKFFSPPLYNLIIQTRQMTDRVEETMRTKREVSAVFDSILLDPSLPAIEKDVPHLVDTAKTLTAAGTFTTATALKVITYFVLADPHVLSKLLAELGTVQPDPYVAAPLSKLEGLPYLSAVIHEGLRMDYGVSHRLTRIRPSTSLQYRDWIIPPGVPVGMSSVIVSDDPIVFPEPHTFRPERWLEPTVTGKPLDFQASTMAFGRGTRICLGMNLALTEIRMALAAVFGRFGERMKLYDTIRERDVDVAHDYFNPIPSFKNKGVRVLIGTP